jgi:hypothetical protein
MLVVANQPSGTYLNVFIREENFIWMFKCVINLILSEKLQ